MFYDYELNQLSKKYENKITLCGTTEFDYALSVLKYELIKSPKDMQELKYESGYGETLIRTILKQLCAKKTKGTRKITVKFYLEG